MKARLNLSGRMPEDIELTDAADFAIFKIRSLSNLLYLASEGPTAVDENMVGAVDEIIVENLDVLKGVIDRFYEKGGENGSERARASRNNRKAAA